MGQRGIEGMGKNINKGEKLENFAAKLNREDAELRREETDSKEDEGMWLQLTGEHSNPPYRQWLWTGTEG
jgi:hypothetical protein